MAESPAELCKVSDIPAGDMKPVRVGDLDILLVNTGDGIFALDNHCIHEGCRLAFGKLTGDTLNCPCHGSVFSVKTGAVISGPATTPQPAHAVIVRNGGIFLAR